MKNTIKLLVLAALVAGFASCAAADNITTFTLSGTFSNGSVLSGTIVINTTTGVIVSGNPITSAPTAFSMPVLTFQGAFGSIYLAQFDTTPSLSFPFIDLLFPTGSLVGYTGGPLCSTSVNLCNNDFSTLDFGADITNANLTVGADQSRGGSTSTPEPATYAMLGAGLIGLAMLRKVKMPKALVQA